MNNIPRFVIAWLTVITTCWTASAQVPDQAKRGVAIDQSAVPVSGDQFKQEVEPLL